MQTETVTSRLERWQGNLLDLTLRNRLLNFGERVSSVELLCSNRRRLLETGPESPDLEVELRQ